MPTPIGHHLGAVWLKLDFQCHTPRDRGWNGSPNLAGGNAGLEADRHAWADSFVAEAIRRGLGAVAVTDHHDVAFLPYIIDAVGRAPPETAPVVYPGIEITCSDNVQCLAIFEPGTEPGLWRRLLAKLVAVIETEAHADRTTQIRHCGLDVEKLFEVVAADEQLAPRTMLIPHFSRDDAHKSLNAEGYAPRFARLPCDGVYIECSHADLDQPTLDKAYGRIEEWGRRRRAILATGDNKNANWDRLGSHHCWVRLGEPTVEALRQAFLADEARIVYLRPQLPANRVVRIEVQSTITGPDPLSIVVNDGFTALIGGRGSGKSAVLEFLRFGLGKSEVDIAPEEKAGRKPRERERTLIDETLRGGWVAVELDRGGLRERWKRSGDNPATIVVVTQGADDEAITVADAQRRFPARAFHQKELSTTMVDPEAAAENITGIAAAEVIEERRRIDAEIAAMKREVTTALQDLAAHWQAELELTRARGRVADMRRRIDAVRVRMAEGGVQEADLAIIREAPRYGRARNYLDDVGRRINEDRDRIGAVIESLLVVDRGRYGDALDFPPVATLDKRLTEIRTNIDARLRTVLQDLNELTTERDQAGGAFQIIQQSFEEGYAKARERQTAHSALIKEAETLAGQLEELEAQETRALERLNVTHAAPAGLSDARAKLAQLVLDRRALLGRAAAEVAEKSAGTLQARISKDRRPVECVQSLCAWMEGSMIRNSDRSCSDWVEAICKDGGQGWAALCDELLKVYRDKIMAGSPPEPGAEAIVELKALMFGGQEKITDNQANRLYTRLSDQSVEIMLSAVPRDSIALTYVSDGQKIAFSRASPGQQASALLELLLRQEAGTLIVDQPEDDLDNRVIMRIVERIRTSKTARQIIFATHNANLVVNGDADKVVTMVSTIAEDRAPEGTTHVRVEVDGAIETPAVRQAVTRIMEGGLEAFDLRARKYGVEGTQRP
ncbi:AAA family ATPase [Methylobacterium sp. WL69]|uniref:TrlF family AAA-like ATPase n=1 Tax=Methylobacterium sp. WL69 TaxID=2603893 RepID=UPI0011C7754C|nr:AAA family ATPase [Methylobacterium sp. WL69]TXM79387.1 AAA family ATPase [Methylobacterium sp. WL69]